jgi:hypothetical protein
LAAEFPNKLLLVIELPVVFPNRLGLEAGAAVVDWFVLAVDWLVLEVDAAGVRLLELPPKILEVLELELPPKILGVLELPPKMLGAGELVVPAAGLGLPNGDLGAEEAAPMVFPPPNIELVGALALLAPPGLLEAAAKLNGVVEDLVGLV